GRQKLWDLMNRPVNKGVWLRFNVETNTPAPYQIKWQVVNTGSEAKQENQLRGEFYDVSPRETTVRWGHTKYAGTHWVQASIVKDGQVVAQTDRKYVKIRRG